MAEKSLLLEYLGESPILRILDFLLDNYLFDYSKKQIMEGAEIGKATFYKYWPRLEREGIIKVTRKFGKTKLYAINRENKFVRQLINAEKELIKKTLPTTVEVKPKPM